MQAIGQTFVPATVSIPLSQVAVVQVLAAQPLSVQILVPTIHPKLLLQGMPAQVLAAQPLSGQFLEPVTQVVPLLHGRPLQVLAAQPLSAQTFVPSVQVEPFQQAVLVQVSLAQPLSVAVLRALQETLAPPLDPAQVQVHGPIPETAEAVPVAQRFTAGIVSIVEALTEPQTPFIATGQTLVPCTFAIPLKQVTLAQVLAAQPLSVAVTFFEALQVAVDPPPDPAQVQVQGPEPETVEAVPAVQRFAAGALSSVVAFDEPQAPLTLTSQILVPCTAAIPLKQVVLVQVLAAQPLSTAQVFVPETQARLLLQVAVMQVLAAQPLSTGQFFVPGIQFRLFQQVVLVQVLAAQELSGHTLVP